MTTTIKPGVAHVAGLYPTSTSFLTDGMTAIKNLGANSKTIKLFLTSDYTTRYPNQTGWGTVANMVDLAASTPMATVLADAQLTDYFLAIFPWWAGFEATSLTNYWINGVSETQRLAEYTAAYNLTAHLLTTYANTGKKFILQNWEGDHQLLDGTDYDVVIKPYVADRMREVLQARSAGVQAARAASSAVGVTVLFGIEVNRVFDPGRRVLREIVPNVHHDLLLYSAYESLVYSDVYAGGTLATAVARIDRNLRHFNAEVRKYTQAPIAISEYGWPEDEVNQTTYPVASFIQQTLDTGQELGFTHAVYWQIYSNEGYLPNPRGFYIVKPDLTYSGAGNKHVLLFA